MCDRSDADFARNKKYDADVRYSIQICRWFLWPIGIWPLIHDRTSRTEKFVSVALMLTCSSSLCFVLIPAGLHTLLHEKDIYARVKLFGPVGFCLTSTIKYIYLGLHGNALRRCLQEVKDDWRSTSDESHREIMIRCATLGRSISILCAAFIYGGGLLYHAILPLWSNVRVKENSTMRVLMYPGYDLFLDPQASPTYEILYLVHYFYSTVTCNITTAACSLAATFVTHACGQIQVIMSRLENLLKKSGSKNCGNDSLGDIVRCHVKLLRFSGSVEEVLCNICLMEIIASTLIICLLEYYCMMEWENHDGVAITTYLLLLVSFTFNIFIFCYIGELLVDQCSKIGLASYEIKWYNLPEREALNLVMIIAISSDPPKLTAGKLVELSLNTFGLVLKSSVVYLNLLRTVTE